VNAGVIVNERRLSQKDFMCSGGVLGGVEVSNHGGVAVR
jgi:hypothetical protein